MELKLVYLEKLLLKICQKEWRFLKTPTSYRAYTCWGKETTWRIGQFDIIEASIITVMNF